MPLRLKDDPREWLKFAAAACCALAALALLLAYRHRISRTTLIVALLALFAGFACAALQPHRLRLPYRFGMTVGYLIGRVVGRMLLFLLFLLAVTPLGLLLRLLGKDLLERRKSPGATSYWHSPKPSNRLDTQF